MSDAIHDIPDPQDEVLDSIIVSFNRVLEQRDRLTERVTRLEVALRDAIRNTARVRRRTIEVDPAGNTYDADWTDQVREWAQLCGLDLDAMDPCGYLGSL